MAVTAKAKLDAHTLRKSEDCYVDELFEPVVALGAPLIAARFPRAYLDVNREPYELDPELFTGRVPEFANTQSARVVGGLGTIFGPVAGAFVIIAMQNYLNALDQWVTVIQGVIFVVCVLLFRRGVIGEIAHLLRIKL